MEKFTEGNKEVADADQKREGDGTFGEKSFLSCSWRTWTKRMFEEYPNIECTCSCNERPLKTGQSLIKHIERKHYVGKQVSFDDHELSFKKSQ